MISPQLRAMDPEIRILDAYIDAIAAYGIECPAVWARVDTAILMEQRSGEGWKVTAGERLMAERGWRSAEDIFDEAGIPDKHRRVVELALWGDPAKHKGRMFTSREIAEMTGHPERTCKLWLSLDMPRLRMLAQALEGVA